MRVRCLSDGLRRPCTAGGTWREGWRGCWALIHQLPRQRFDTVVMFGNNFGLVGSYWKAKRLLRQLHDITTDGAVVLAETVDPGMTGNPAHLRYQRRNRLRRRMPGQIRIRIRFERCVGRWFDYLLVSPAEMADILKGTRSTTRSPTRTPRQKRCGACPALSAFAPCWMAPQQSTSTAS
jgi:hypothetical protein